MNLSHFSEAPVEKFFPVDYKRFGFVRAEEGSTAAFITEGRDIFFHLDNFRSPVIHHGRVKFSDKAPSPECLDFVAAQLEKGTVLAFDIRRVEKGFAAEPWTLRSIWREQLRLLSLLPVYRLSRVTTACKISGDEKGAPEVVWEGNDFSSFKRETCSLALPQYSDPDGFYRVDYLWEKKNASGIWEKSPWPVQAK